MRQQQHKHYTYTRGEHSAAPASATQPHRRHDTPHDTHCYTLQDTAHTFIT
jgi:hypothetical protein